MTSITLSFSDEELASFQAEAQAQGITLEAWLKKVAVQEAGAVSIAHLQENDPKQWARQFDEWVDGHDPNTPVLSEEAMSRESLYPDRR